MKRVIFAFLLFALVALVVTRGRAQVPQISSCPDGSYEITREKTGDPICKLEPTGCPYGDSIPLDSPKCSPPPMEVIGK